ncbi:MAG: TetR/AcrR family transcriptional regulator [Actinomycetota bacterium]
MPLVATGPRSAEPASDGRAFDRRDLVMRCAVDAIAFMGLGAVRLEDIAARAHMSIGHVMYYFGTRDRLLLATLLWSEDDARRELGAATARMRSPERRLARFVTAYLPTAARDPRWGLWFQLSAAPGEPVADTGALREVDASWRAVFTELVRSGIDAGAFRSVDPDDLAEWFLPYLDGLALDILTGPPGAAVTPTVHRAQARIRRALTDGAR